MSDVFKVVLNYKNLTSLSLSRSTGLKGPLLPADTQPITATVCQLGTVSFTWQCLDVLGIIWVVDCQSQFLSLLSRSTGLKGPLLPADTQPITARVCQLGTVSFMCLMLSIEDVLMYRG